MTEAATFDEIVNFTLGNTAMSKSQGLTLLRKDLNVMCILTYVANDNTWLCKRKNKAPLERALEKVN